MRFWDTFVFHCAYHHICSVPMLDAGAALLKRFTPRNGLCEIIGMLVRWDIKHHSSPDGILLSPSLHNAWKRKDRGPQTEAPERPQSLISSLLRVKEDRERKEGGRASQRSPEEASKERLRGSPGEGAPEQVEEGEAQKEAPERSRSRLGLVF